MIGIVIVTWNSEEVIGVCLDACLALPDVQVVVVDNASSDGTVAEVRRRPQVQLVVNETNLGFAGGVNQGIAMLHCPAVLILNPDAVPVRGLDQLAAAAISVGVGAAAGTLLDPEGVPQDGFNVRTFPTPWTLSFEVLGLNRLAPWNPVNRAYRTAVRTTQVTDVDQPAGAFLMVNRAAWAAVAGFDEGFHPVWFEDVDFCRRLRSAGYRIVYVPAAAARHIGGHSATRVRWEDRQVFWYGNLLRYAAAHFEPAGRRLVAASVVVGLLPRAAFGLVIQRTPSAVSVYSKLFRVACRCWRKGARLSDLQASRITRKGERGPAVLS